MPTDLQDHALFFEPQVGYHSVLIQPDPTHKVFENFTEDHTLYYFTLQRLLQPFDRTYSLEYIQDANGNRTDLYYQRPSNA